MRDDWETTEIEGGHGPCVYEVFLFETLFLGGVWWFESVCTMTDAWSWFGILHLDC